MALAPSFGENFYFCLNFIILNSHENQGISI